MTRAAVAFGGNLGRPRETFRDALAALAAEPGVTVLAASRLWRSEPWGLRDQPAFLNAAVLLETWLAPAELLARLKAMERSAGRTPGLRWGPRPLDLDLLFHGDDVRTGTELTLPHPGLPERTFVLEPLAEIAPGWVHPVHGKRCAELLAELRASGRATECRPAGRWAAAAPETSPWR
jgi:2-amino-4-hydroxy-6-hydroxymethyldihydropteridine diphosphokinase